MNRVSAVPTVVRLADDLKLAHQDRSLFLRTICALDTAIHSQRESDPVPGGHVGFPFVKRLAGANQTNGSGAAPFTADLHRTRVVPP